MSRTESLKRLEKVLESFLERATALKDERLSVLDGMNRLDDLTRLSSEGAKVADDVADWFADKSFWPNNGRLRDADCRRIEGILEHLQTNLQSSDDGSPAHSKVLGVIEDWLSSSSSDKGSITLRRQPESAEAPEIDTIHRFKSSLESLAGLFENLAHGKQHLMSTLDAALTKANEEKNTEALLLSACVIYFMRLDNYKVEPYVKRLRQAEQAIKESSADA